MADTQTGTKIGDISSQLTKASRLLMTDSFWVQTGGDANGNGQSILIPAEFVRAYISGFVNSNFRVGDNGIEASFDGGKSWKEVLPWDDMPFKFKNLNTQREYDDLAASGKVDDKTYYCIFEE